MIDQIEKVFWTTRRLRITRTPETKTLEALLTLTTVTVTQNLFS